MFSASTALLAFFIGIVGCIFGGTQTFIVTGFVGLFIYALQAVGIQSEFLTETLMNTVFFAGHHLQCGIGVNRLCGQALRHRGLGH